jgi:hypothetical protein
MPNFRNQNADEKAAGPRFDTAKLEIPLGMNQEQTYNPSLDVRLLKRHSVILY